MALFSSFAFTTKKKEPEALACIQNFIDRGVPLGEVTDEQWGMDDGAVQQLALWVTSHVQRALPRAKHWLWSSMVWL